MAQTGTATLRQLSSFIGKATAMLGAVFPARLQTRHLLQVKNDALKMGSKWSDTVKITDEATQDLLWWRTNLRSWNGHTWIPRATDMDVYTDASDKGWGIVIDDTTWSGQWSSKHRDLHINHKELLTVLFALKLPVCRGRMLNIVSDNMTTLTYINHFGGTRSAALMQMVTQLWKHCLQTGTRLRTTYMPSAFNPADAPSQQLTSQLEWSISNSFFTLLNNKWGPHHIDLFVTATNTKLQQFMSWKPCPLAIATDALSQTWKG